MAGNASMSRDAEPEMAGSSGPRRRRLPAIPRRKTTGNRRDDSTATHQNGDDDDDDDDVRMTSSGSSNSEDLQPLSTGSEPRSVAAASAANSDDGEEKRRFRSPERRAGGTAAATVARTARSRRVSWADEEARRTGGAVEHHPGTTPSRRRPSLFALLGSCRLVSATLGVPRRRDDVIDDVIRLTEVAPPPAGDAGIAAGGSPRRHGGVTAPRSAFRRVGQATAATTELGAKSADDVSDDRDGLSLVVVSSVRRDIVLPRCGQQLLPGDILLEVLPTRFLEL